MAVNMNHEGYSRRLEVIESTLKAKGLQASKIEPVEYIENGPMPYNNFIYKVEIVSPMSAGVFPASSQPFTTTPIDEISTFIFRMSNPKADGVNNTNRIENEIAALHLCRKALSNKSKEYAKIVPAVYDWASQTYPSVPDESGFGWIMMEFLPGVPLDKEFASMEAPQRSEILEQIAIIFSVLQAIQLPSEVDSHGGLTIKNGEIVSGQPTIAHGGPWKSYRGWWEGLLLMAVSQAESSPVLKGWKENGLRGRIDKFIQNGIEPLLKDVDGTKRVLVHGDFTTNNVLYNPETKKISGLLDFDFTVVTHPYYEFAKSFSTMGWHGNEAIGAAIIKGEFGEEPPAEAGAEDWNLAKEWHAALAEQDAQMPSSIKGIESLRTLGMLEALLCPVSLYYPFMLKRHKPEDLHKMMAAAEGNLSGHLESLGY
ncbi:hypothetical protein FKW77_004693 [Venturia effusa]|uniref:Aminoglycoside phosphotransferase domain-containing protein n=1 Tax=Venturia effusa TaxID=50376 RepID=A0A517LDM2_9PEZI|nr:hypothetical protein FKW77_004693 [Venturia effusa]